MKSFRILAVAAMIILLAGCKENFVPTISVTPSGIVFEQIGGTQVLNVKSNTSWTVSKNADWIKVSPVAGNGDGQVTVIAGENGALNTISGLIVFTAGGTEIQEVSVEQMAKVPFIDTDTKSINCTSEEGTYTINVSSNVAWTASITQMEGNWASLDKTSGDGNGTIKVTVNKQRDLEERTASIEIKETASGSMTIIMLQQEAGKLSRYTDSLALVALYNASDGANWAKNKWDLEKPMTEWFGVRVKNERVDSLKFGVNTIKTAWELPAELGNLSELVCFSIMTCSVKGDLPSWVYNFTKVKTVELSGNDITGSFTSDIKNWKEVGYITMLNNKNFGGSIPKEMGELKKLFRLNLSNTSISGSIPEEIKGCENMQEFMIFSAKLTGEVPDIWDSFKNDFKILMLYGNDLTGSLPASLGKVTTSASTFSIQLKNCNFTGNVPEEWATLPSVCKQLMIQGNKLSGTVPAAVKAHANWNTWKPATNIFPQQDGYGLE